MRTKRGQYKTCGRLGYNARLRFWSGKKKKWRKTGRFQVLDSDKGTKSAMNPKPVNPVTVLTNEQRIGVGDDGRSRSSKSKRRGKRPFSSKRRRIRRKATHAMAQNQKTGRKRRYGGVKLPRRARGRKTQRQELRRIKWENERKYRKGRRERGRSQSRMAQTETRVDVRRWRSGRVPTLQMGRDLIEHGKIREIGPNGEDRGVVRWQGKIMDPGTGRKVTDPVWKTLKGKARELVREPAYAKTGVTYREVDYVAGRRILLRKPVSGEVRIPKGMERTAWNTLG